MDVSNLTKVPSGSMASAATGGNVALTANVGASIPLEQGNSLPDAGPSRIRPEDPQNKSLTTQLDIGELRSLVDQVNTTLQGRFSELKFTVAEGTDTPVVRVEDKETGELIRQFPSEAMVAIARALGEAQQGMMLEEKA